MKFMLGKRLQMSLPSGGGIRKGWGPETPWYLLQLFQSCSEDGEQAQPLLCYLGWNAEVGLTCKSFGMGPGEKQQVLLSAGSGGDQGFGVFKCWV